MVAESYQSLSLEHQADPPKWLLASIGLLYLTGIAIMVFWPGATLIERLRAIDGGICAQLPSHTLFPGGVRLPLCSRNTGIYLGVIIGIGYIMYRGRGKSAEIPTGIVRNILFSGVALMAIDGFNSLFVDLGLPHLYQPNNLLRLATGLLTGIAVAAFLLPVTNSVLWQKYDDRASIAHVAQLLPLIPVLAVAFVLVASHPAWTLYPGAIISTLGVVGTVFGINLTLLVSVSRKVGRYSTIRQSIPMMALALAASVGELMILFNINHVLLQGLG